MKSDNQQATGAPAESKPNPRFIAQQLRRPSGEFAPDIGRKMNQVNKPLYDLTYDKMEINKGDHLLEIGFGNGAFFSVLFAKMDDLRISGIDFSEEMVEAAIENNRDAIAEERLELKIGSSESIPYPDQYFDSAFCNMVVYFWDQPEKHLREIHRILKPSGTFYTGMRTRDSMLVFPFVEHGFNLYKIKEWASILDRNGFSVKATHKRTDPDIEVEDNMVHLESCCIVAEKKAL